METGKLQLAEKTMLQKKNINQSLEVYTKVEPKPNFINPELQAYYDATDLEAGYVFDCCKALKPLKGIDVNAQQVEFWYKEFIRMGWTKSMFNKQFDKIKRATLFNRIDLENWLTTDIMYNEHDFNVAIKRKIDSLIAKGKFLKDKKVELSEEDKKCIDLAIAQEIEFQKRNEKLNLADDYRQERRRLFSSTYGH